MPGELKALAHVRLDAADGVLDGHADTTAVELNRTAAAEQYNSERVRRLSGDEWRRSPSP